MIRNLLRRLEAGILRFYYRWANKKAWRDHPMEDVSTSTLQIPDGNRTITARMYHGDVDKPMVVFYHGGGWVIGDLNTHDPFCRALCQSSHCSVMSIDYRLAPEAPFPAAHDDCLVATRWIFDNLNRLAPNNGKVVLSGDSAGGNLTASTAFALLDEPRLSGALMIYPATEHYSAAFPSYTEHAKTGPLRSSLMRWFTDTYLGGIAPATPALKKIFVARNNSWKKFPRSLVITAERDPLRDDGRRFAQILRRDGVEVRFEHFLKDAHGFACSEGPTHSHKQVIAIASEWLAAG